MFFRISNLTVINLFHVVRVAHSPSRGRLKATTTVLMRNDETEVAIHGERAVELWRLMRALTTADGRSPAREEEEWGMDDYVGLTDMTLDSATIAG